MAATEDIRVATIAKNQIEELRITLTNFKGHDLVDIRIFAEPYADDGEGKRATKKGVCLSLEKLPELIEALQKAEEEARAHGLLDVEKAA